MFDCNFADEDEAMECVPDTDVCDGDIECTNGADEKYCSKYRILQ